MLDKAHRQNIVDHFDSLSADDAKDEAQKLVNAFKEANEFATDQRPFHQAAADVVGKILTAATAALGISVALYKFFDVGFAKLILFLAWVFLASCIFHGVQYLSWPAEEYSRRKANIDKRLSILGPSMLLCSIRILRQKAEGTKTGYGEVFAEIIELDDDIFQLRKEVQNLQESKVHYLFVAKNSFFIGLALLIFSASVAMAFGGQSP